MRSLRTSLAAVLIAGLWTGTATAAGTLAPIGATDQPIQILDHDVSVVINNGFARTEVTQTFFNPNPVDLEAIYAFPVPKSASLSEVTIFVGELTIDGEVIERGRAEQIYQDEKSQGSDAGLATKETYQRFEFRVTPVRANAETRVRFVYYQPLPLDAGIGRYLYPLQEGGTDELAQSFWVPNEKVERSFSVNVELKSAVPVAEVRVPGHEGVAQVDRLGDGHYRIRVEHQGALLNSDFVVYYRLEEAPGRVELVAYKPDADEPGHFMMVVTPGIDLQPLSSGSDVVFVLDISGSMSSKIQTLAGGVAKALGNLRPEDRFRIVVFESRGHELTPGWLPATVENTQRIIRELEALQATGSTNLFEGLELALDRLDDDRATSLILVTDAVTNTGVVDPREFHRLLVQHDLRLFGFLMGNSGNWPLMRTIANATGGFYAPVSNADDVLGQILLAKSKVTHEALHGVDLEIRGVKTYDTTGELIRKLYRGQQLVLFGRYEDGGEATVALTARITGQDRVYQTRFAFPDQTDDDPEIERLFALATIEELEDRMNAGLLPADEGNDAILDLGLQYQLVTDETAMLVLTDEAFERHGIDRHNRTRVGLERAAQARRAVQAPVSRRVDRPQPMFKKPAPRLGGGAFEPTSGVIALTLALLARRAFARRERKGH